MLPRCNSLSLLLSEQLDLQQLISSEEISGTRPTHLLRHMPQLLGDKLDVSDNSISFSMDFSFNTKLTM